MNKARPFSEEELAQFDRIYADIPDEYKHDTLLRLRATITERDKQIEELKKELLTIAEDAVIDARLRWAEEEVLLKSTPDTATAIYCRKCGKAYPSDYDDWVYHEKDQRYYCRECSKVEPDPRQIDIDVAKAIKELVEYSDKEDVRFNLSYKANTWEVEYETPYGRAGSMYYASELAEKIRDVIGHRQNRIEHVGKQK